MQIENVESETRLSSDVSMSESYIILMNNALQERNKQFIIKIKDTEEQLSRTTELSNNMKKLIKIFEDIESARKKICENKSKIINITRSNVKNYTNKAKHHLKYLQTLMILFSVFFYEYFDFNSAFPVVMLLIIISAFQESTISALQLPLCEDEENSCFELKDKIKKSIKSQDYIYTFLENV
jgi:uncharacterized membrane protein